MKNTHFVIRLVCVTIGWCLVAAMTTEFVKFDVLNHK